MTLHELRDALLTITPNVYHYFAHREQDKYIVWAEDNYSETLYADGRINDMAVQGTIDYYSKEEFDPVVQAIQAKLTDLEVSWRLNSVQYEEKTEYIHHEWIWELV